MNFSKIIKTIKDKFNTREIKLADTASIPHIGIVANGEIIDWEHDYSLLKVVLEINTGESNELDVWEGKKYLFIFSEDGENVSGFKLMGESEKLSKILFNNIWIVKKN